MKLEPKRVLLAIWFGFSTISTVISIASLAEDLIAWNMFILGLISSYRDIVNFFWGGLFSFFSLRFPQGVHDYLTINTLCATAIAWALYNSSNKLGFVAIGSFWLFLKNNLASVVVAVSYLSNFAAGAIAALEKSPDGLTNDVRKKIQQLAQPHRSTRLIFEAVIAVFLFLVLFGIGAFFIPPLMYWLDVRNCNSSSTFMASRRTEILSSDLSPEHKEIVLAEFDPRLQSARDEVQIVKLYHHELWKSLLWYFVAVLVSFGLAVLSNYLSRRLG